MIVVIADDFTGAAEMAGIGLRFGLRVELVTKAGEKNDADLMVWCTDSRSLSKDEAIVVTTKAVEYAIGLQPQLLYKKIDSVLRGHVLDEIKVQMSISGLHKALIIPANPSLGRTIRDGQYFIHDKPANETAFAVDPEFAIGNSSVQSMIGGGEEVQVLPVNKVLPRKGIVVGEASASADILKWTEKIEKDSVIAGAGDFFAALLSKRYKERPYAVTSPGSPHLYISGTTFEKAVSFVRSLDRQLHCVAYLPGNDEQAWLQRVSRIIETQNRLVIAFDNNKIPAGTSAASLRQMMAIAVKRVLAHAAIKEIFIEGGATAAWIIRELGITCLSPVEEWERGVVRMKAGDLFITVKPGSYELPHQIKTIYT